MIAMRAAVVALALGAAAAAGTPSGEGGARGLSPSVTPETRAEGFRFVVERIVQSQNLALEYDAGGTGRLSGRKSVSIELAVFPPRPQDAPRIEGLAARCVRGPDGEPALVLRSFDPEDGPAVVAGAWRTTLVAPELPLAVTTLRGLRGELVIYPEARRLTLDFPVAGKLPQVQEGEGVRYTLRRAGARNGTFSAELEGEWEASRSVLRANPDAPEGITALTRAGSVLIPDTASVNARTLGGSLMRRCVLTFSDLKEPPERVRVDLIVRSGTPRRLAFVLPDLPLPDTLEIPADSYEGGASGRLERDHPLYAEPGGAVRIVLPGPPNGGTVLVGLSLQEGRGAGAWRWLEVTAPEGIAHIGPLRPGNYRVRVRLPGEPSRAGASSAVRVTAGREATVALTGGGG